jgi:hypothetical protein
VLTERDLENPDPLRLDREIARAAEALRAHRRSLACGEGWDDDPFVTTRLVTGSTTFMAVQAMPDLDPLKVPLLRWVYRLADQRINRVALVRVAAESGVTEHVVSEPERARIPLSEMLNRGLASPKRREAWLGSFIGKSEQLGAAVATLWERRQEVAQRLRLSGPDSMEGIGASAPEAARAWLDRTRDAFTEIKENNAKAFPGLGGLSGLVSVALAETAVEGWPRHLLPRTILDLFCETDLFRGVELDPGRLPEAFAPASFLRALTRVGAAWVDATAPNDQPFVVAHDPYGLRRRTMGALLGTLPASPAFARRALGVDGARLVDHRRGLSAALLVASRLAALRVLLRGPALAGRRALREAFESEVHRELGITLPATAAGAVFRLHEDDAQRFAGLLLSARTAAMLRDANDEDWYRNPRTVEQLRDEARLSPEPTTTDEALAEGAAALEAALIATL